jgi:DNA ligase (NAD+)
MLSLDKTKDIKEIKSFIGNKDWIAMLKLDGLTCRLTYEEGKLVRAETRGDGVEGEDITHNALVLPSIPKVISYKGTLVVDGEVICDLETFEQFKREYANARNFAAGSIRLLDSKECAKRGLTFVAWDLIIPSDNTFGGMLAFKLCSLKDMGFKTVPYLHNCLSVSQEDIDALLSRAADKHYPIDGIVFKWDNCKEYEAAGRTEHHFRGGLAYKFYDEEYETELLDLEWSMGRTGVLTPVAVYKDVEIDGATCNRANLHNINILTELLGDSPLVGQKVWVYKANAIIPQIAKAQPAEEILGADPAYFWNDPEFTFLKPPSECPMCGGETEVIESDSGTLELYCTNPQCPGKLVNKLDHFCGKKGLDIKGLSKATLEKLIDWGWVTRTMDLFYLHHYRREWIEKPGFGIKSVDKILDAVEAARHTTLEKYLSAISIPLIGKTYARQLAQTYDDYDIFRLTVRSGADFTELDGFGPAMHDAIVKFDYTEADMMYNEGLVIIEEGPGISALENSGNALEGKTFCVTGKIKHWKNRDELSAAIAAAGGKVTSSVSSKTNYLVNNDINSTSSKNLKAKELNIPIITEEELLAMFN